MTDLATMIDSCKTRNPIHAARWENICRDQENGKLKWIALLRSQGVAAAHPDDGWANRKTNTVQFVYPQFNDGATVGSVVALGWHFNKTYRLVRLVGTDKGILGVIYWKFEDIRTVPTQDTKNTEG